MARTGRRSCGSCLTIMARVAIIDFLNTENVFHRKSRQPMETAPAMSGTRMSPVKPSVYWDRNDHVVRDWSTNQAIPAYEGPCLVYLDIRGPVLLNTFLCNGERHWDGVE
jgi:hypothetical protein